MGVINMDLKFKHTAAGLKVPKFVDGCINIYASEEAMVQPSSGNRIKTNIIFEVPEGYGLLIVPSSAMAGKSTLRFANSVIVLTSSNTEELTIPVETVVQKSLQNDVYPGYFLLTGEFKKDYSKGYLPVNTVVVQKGDCVGKGYLVKLETPTISRSTKKEKVKENEEDEA